MEAALHTHTFNEVKYYLMATPCSACGKGPRTVDATGPPGKAGEPIIVQIHCRSCNRQQGITFCYDHEPPAEEVSAECINPTDEPSRIIDLSQWLGLFYMLAESAWQRDSAPSMRRVDFQAALCLAEALKFYGDDELPPASAFSTAEGIAAFRDHPEKFARQKLRDMQAKLPTLPTMAPRVERDKNVSGHKWWKFWKK